MKKQKIAIIGGGIMGTCVAAALAGKGRQIVLFEAGPELLGEASIYNEGRIHLGYTYGMDRSLETARLMVKTTLKFERLLVSWFGKKISQVPRSTCFNYLVHKEGLMNTDEYAPHARKVSEIIRETFEKGDTYFGANLKMRPRRLSSDYLATYYNSDKIAAVFKTNELSIDPEAVATVIREEMVRIPGVEIRLNAKVAAIKPIGSKYKVRGELFDAVVNASGRSLFFFDSMLGLKLPVNPLFRLKYLLRTREKTLDCPSTGIVLGKFGDVATFPGILLLNWYPAGRRQWYEGLSPKKAKGVLENGTEAAKIKEEIIAGLVTVVPRFKGGNFENSDLKGGWIYAPGSSDINNPKSQLHRRTDIGIKQKDNYFSIDPGKYITAPYFAWQLALRFK